MQSPRHTFDTQLHALEQRLLRMGSFVEEMLEDSVKALVDKDVSLAEEVIRRDDVADELDLDIETSCMHMLALQQPLSKDLRVIGTALKITTDLERIGDYSVDIAKTALELVSEPVIKPLVRIPQMAQATARMVRGALEAFVSRDPDKIEEVVRLDDEVDELNRQVWNMMIQEMQENPSTVSRAAHLILVARYLERIADHAVNVAERVQYMETGVLRQLASSHQML
jgi:phosphate transport system protein